MRRAERERFDQLLEAILEELPPRVRELLEEVSLIVDDVPDPALLVELGIEPGDDLLCGLHSGVPLTQRSVMDGVEMPEVIHLFREGIVELAGGWERVQDEDGEWMGGEEAIAEEIRVTLLHEIGHHYGLDEDDLRRLGYE